ncbi:MAG: hypothetical protein JKY94_17760 [Rhodobacteraceae bacterium]|nr:hypothetical protein [Paracoccaceae bacterium]
MGQKTSTVWAFIEKHEGRRKKPYTDTLGVLTVGVGCNLSRGLTDAQIDALYAVQLKTAADDAKAWLGPHVFAHLTDARKTVLISMAFQFGASRLAKFKKTRAALRAGDYDTTVAEMLDSKWAKSDSPRRALNHARIMKKGSF